MAEQKIIMIKNPGDVYRAVYKDGKSDPGYYVSYTVKAKNGDEAIELAKENKDFMNHINMKEYNPSSLFSYQPPEYIKLDYVFQFELN